MEVQNRRNIIWGGISLVLFFIIAWLAPENIGLSIDHVGLKWGNQEHTDGVRKLMEIISKSSSIALVLATFIFTILFVVKRKWSDFIFYYFVLAGGIAFNLILKAIIQRPRPEGRQFYELLGMKIESFSFPSGHTMRATVLVLLLIYFAYKYLKKQSYKSLSLLLCIAYIISMGASRVFLKMHFITDVLGAVLASLAWVFVCVFIFNWIENKRALKKG